MNITPFATQERLIAHALNAETRVVFFGGGIRGGKTFAALLALFLYLRANPGARAHIVRDSLPTLFRNTVPSYNKVTNYKRIENQQQLQTAVPVRGGSTLNFFAENYAADKELNRWRGLETNAFLLEEVNELEYATFLKAIERAGSWIVPDSARQPPPKIICTLNPSAGWVKEKVYDRYVAGTLPAGWVYIPALLSDNPHLPEAYKQNLLNLPEREYRTFVLGDWDAWQPEGRFADEFDEARHVRPVAFVPAADVYLSFDFNQANTCVVRQSLAGERRFVREFHFRANLDAFAVSIRDWLRAGAHTGRIWVNGDASGASGTANNNEGLYEVIRTVLGLSWTAFNVPRANSSHAFSSTLTNVVLKHGDVVIDPSCAELIKDLRTVRLEPGKKPLRINKKDLTRGHWLDAFRYSLYANDQPLLERLGLATQQHALT